MDRAQAYLWIANIEHGLIYGDVLDVEFIHENEYKENLLNEIQKENILKIDGKDILLSFRQVLLNADLLDYSENDRCDIKTPIKNNDILSKSKSTPKVMPALSVGDIIAVHDFVAYPPEDGSSHGLPNLQVLREAIVVGQAESRESAAVKIFNDCENFSRNKFSYNYTCAVSTVDYHVGYWQAKKERNQALIFSWIKENGKIEGLVLNHKGVFFYQQNYHIGGSLEDCGVQAPESGGLFVLNNGEPWTRTDWESGHVDDYGIDGDIEPISLDEAADNWGFTVDNLLKEIEDQYPYILEAGITVLEAAKYPGGEKPPGPALLLKD
jgi:hypothetical protein